jgi:hypothetical protein
MKEEDSYVPLISEADVVIRYLLLLLHDEQ